MSRSQAITAEECSTTGVGILRKRDGYYFTKSCCPLQTGLWGTLNNGCASFRFEVCFRQTVNFQSSRVTTSFHLESPKQREASFTSARLIFVKLITQPSTFANGESHLSPLFSGEKMVPQVFPQWNPHSFPSLRSSHMTWMLKEPPFTPI